MRPEKSKWSHCNIVERVKGPNLFKKKQTEHGMRTWMVSLTMAMRVVTLVDHPEFIHELNFLS